MSPNNTKKQQSNFLGRFWPVALAAAILLTATTTGVARVGNAGNPGVLPAQSHPYGKSYSQWTAAWWQWALSIPADRSPLTDTGKFAAEGQSGPVWFLAWSFGSSVEKSSTIPAGKAIFTPVYNWVFGSGVFDCEPTVPGVACDVESLRVSAAANTEAAEILEVTLDGTPVQSPRIYRAASPEPFSITYPENSVVGVPAGTYFPQVADGYWLMLAPLPVGEHEIRVHVAAPAVMIEFTSVYHLTVTSGK